MLKGLHPSYWTWRTYVGTAVVLICVNLFGPKGVLHFLILKHEAGRLSQLQSKLQHQITDVEKEMKAFSQSNVARGRAIREELGYLKPNELSIEFLNTASGDSQ